RRYQVIEEIGKGGMGKVYKVLDTELREKVALKLLSPEIAADKETIERFRNELKFARKITHKNVCRMYDLSREEGAYYITMEFVPGENLKGTIRRIGQLPVGKSISIAKQVCEGLVEAHKLGVMHRDLKPQNIMVDEEGNARIMDFGIARSLKAKGITDAGVIIGTPEYMSPEQAEVEDVDQRSDIYCLGVILYEMVTGKVPFQGDTALSIAMKHKSEEPQPPKEVNAQIPEDLNLLVLRCMEKDKEKRYQKAEELLSELMKIEKGISTTERIIVEKKSKAEIPRKPYQAFLIPAIFIFVVLIAIISFLFFGGILRKGKPEADALVQADLEKKIVVLPFENLGLPEDEYFAAGMTEEITSRLAAVSGLGVISRSSAVQYDRKGKMMKQIGEDFGVAYVLEGTVRWDHGPEGKNRVRVTPQLIRTADDTHLWSTSYDRVIDDIFAVQSEIAEQVISQLGITLMEPERRGLNAKPTENIEAYQAYLRGLNYLYLPDFAEENFQMAVEMLERAVDVDPGFALAYAELSYAYSQLYHFGYDRTEECISMAKAAIDRAFELQPELPEVHMHLGNYYYYVHKEYDKALEEFAIAEQGLPNDTRIFEYKAYIWRRQAKFKESTSLLKRAIELSPQDAGITLNLAISYMALREYQEAEDCYNRSIFLAPDQTEAHAFKAMNYWMWEGDLGKARAALEQIPVKKNPLVIYFWVLQEMLERNYQAALDRLSSASVDCFEGADFFMPKAQSEGLIYQLMNKPELARTSFDSARIILEKEINARPDDPRLHSSLGIVYASLGRKEEAIREGKLAIKLYPVSKDALTGTSFMQDLASIYIIVGEYEAALDQIEYLLSIPSWQISAAYLRIEPEFDPLREHPRFKRLLKK
ncbi:MAG: protein kinase, partial [Candidatus Aminicenantes bacterium]|nr:protein kinase [Candidatus Aminicenantes bacterium]